MTAQPLLTHTCVTLVLPLGHWNDVGESEIKELPCVLVNPGMEQVYLARDSEDRWRVGTVPFYGSFGLNPPVPRSSRLRLAVCPGGSPDAGTALGRFTGLLHVAERDCDDAGLVAEVVARPRVSEGMTLAPPAGFAARRIPVGVPAEPGDVLLDDLLLVSDGHRLILWSSSQDRQVIPVLYSRLTSHLLPPLVRFLRLVGRTGCRPLHGWSWEPAGGGPFTPRVRYRRTILAPARWVLPPTLTRTTRDRASWLDVLKRWRAETVPAPPNVIVVDDGDRCLPLDLDQADDRELLRRYAGRGVTATWPGTMTPGSGCVTTLPSTGRASASASVATPPPSAAGSCPPCPHGVRR
ncbi:MAG: lantibiotic dehydratase [Pseudonocardiaceae bacterium]